MASAKFLNLFEEEQEKNPEDDAAPDVAQSTDPGEVPSPPVADAQPASQETDDHHADLRLQQDDAPRAEDARDRHWLKTSPCIRRCAAARRRPSSARSSPATTWSWPARRRSACSASSPSRRPTRVSPIRFVNIRETGGWSRDAKSAMPKIAALLAAASLPEPDPVSTVSYKSQGRLLIVGALDEAEQAAALVGDTLDVTIFSQGPGAAGGAQERRWPVIAGRIDSLAGWLGAFKLQWTRDNPIDLDLCTRCNACVAVCPEEAIGLDYQIDIAKCTSHRACVQGLRGGRRHRFQPRAAGVLRRQPSTWCSTSAPRRSSTGTRRRRATSTWRAAWRMRKACRRCCACASWSASSRSRSSSTTSKSSARTAATRWSAATPASRSAPRTR